MRQQAEHLYILSEPTEHHARHVGFEMWAVSWLPGRTLTEQQATVAVTIAALAATATALPNEHLDALARTLGMTGREALGYASSPCTWTQPRTPSPETRPTGPLRRPRWFTH
jgi:hypothetical protein